MRKLLRNMILASKEAWRLAKPYFRSEDKWKAYSLLAAIMLLNIIIVYGQVLNTYWFKYSYDALQKKNAASFWKLAITYQHVPDFPYLIPGFLAIGILLTVTGTYAVYLQQMLQIRWWKWLTREFVGDWMRGGAYYKLALTAQQGSAVDNPDQRIANDLELFVSANLNLSISFVTNIISIVSYVGILWAASAPMRLFGLHVPGYLVWAALLYSGLGTVFTHLIGYKLIGLNFRQQQYQADLRFNLVRVRENTEQIALYRGEEPETTGIMGKFGWIYDNWWQIMRRTKALNFFTLGFSNAAIFFSLIVGAPDYFAGIISLGVLMLINSSFGNVQSAFSWFVGAYPQIVAWRATVQRLDEFERAVRVAHQDAVLPALQVDTRGEKLVADNLAINLPNGVGLLRAPHFEIRRGGPVAITGVSGSGKSTLLRTLAGIWPFSHGKVIRPEGNLMFLPQRPYLPLGTLKRAAAYPHDESTIEDEAVGAALDAVGLGGFTDQLGEVDNWALRLSGGEQQRLAIARALLLKPDWLFLDEAMSALDEPSARSLFALLQTRLPEAQIISVAHHASMVDLHARVASLKADEKGVMRLELGEAVPSE